MNFIFSTLIVILIILLFTIFAAWIDKFNAKLKDLGIIYSQSGQWHLKMPYKGWNLAGTRTYNYQSSNGETLTSTTLVWNQRGKRFIIALYNNDFNVKRAIDELAGDNKNK